jgi:nitrate reductase NapAB chaperone NapD
MGLQRLRTRENAKGGGNLWIRQISPTASNTFLDVGWLGGTTLDDKQTAVESKDERGDLVIVLYSDRTAMLKTILHQVSQDEIDLVNKLSNNNVFYDVYYSALLENGDIQEISAAICQIKMGVPIEYKSSQRTLPCDIYMLAPAAAFTRTPTAFNVVVSPERIPYVMTEIVLASAYGKPTDTASSLATAVL